MDNVNGEKLALAETTKAAVDIIAKKKASIDFTFPKRPKVDIEFQNVKYTVKKFSLKNRAFGEYLKNKEWVSECEQEFILVFSLWFSFFKKWVNSDANASR